ncbi:MAG: DUF3800 domain-containing protein [Planctomycetes bacterium]|nr:DUF3800 domain-containing protein [Planctomycetota bacterium]
MGYLLFLDESRHDHRSMPYEVRGGVALHASELWPFVQALQRLELAAFGTELHLFRTELKGSRLLGRDRFKWAAQGAQMSDEERRRQCRSFLTKGAEKKTPTRDEFTAYGQACLDMAEGMFGLLGAHRATVFAAAIPRGIAKPDGFQAQAYLRKDHVFLFERYFYFLEQERQHGLLVLDEVDKAEDRRFVRRLEAYFQRTNTGRYRSAWIVPTPFFVSSEMTYPVQAADLTIYCVNWGFRVANRGMDAVTRPEIAERFEPWLRRLQFRGEGYRDGGVFGVFGIVFVPDPFDVRRS